MFHMYLVPLSRKVEASVLSGASLDGFSVLLKMSQENINTLCKVNSLGELFTGIHDSFGVFSQSIRLEYMIDILWQNIQIMHRF